MKKNYKEEALIFKALSDETRLEIISLLSEKELCACKILETFNITQPTLSYHMKILVESKLVNAYKDGLWVKYTINTNVIQGTLKSLNGILSTKGGNKK